MSREDLSSYHCVVSLDGKIVPAQSARLSVFDQAVLLGYGLFETILAVNDDPIRLRDHLARLNRSRKALKIQSRFSQSEIGEIVRQTIAAHPERTKRARVTLTAGTRGFWSPEAPSPGSLVVIVLPHLMEKNVPERAATLIESATADHWLAGHKTTSRAPYMFPDANPPEYDSKSMTLLYSKSRGVTEFTNSAVMARHGATVTVPPLDRALPGVTRNAALRVLTRSDGWKVREQRLPSKDLWSAEEIIGLNALAPVFVVSKLTTPGGKAKSFTDKTLAEYLRPRLFPRGVFDVES